MLSAEKRETVEGESDGWKVGKVDLFYFNNRCIMEVTRHNFKTALPLIETAIKICDFISIDTEFTGLDTLGDDPCTLFDTASERYCKDRRAVRAFTLTQVGIACFKKNLQFNKYEATVFNIYVYPTAFGEHNATFSARVSSLNFLGKHQFDFNKFIYEGVPFLNRHDAQAIRSDLESGIVDSDLIDPKYFADTCQLLTEWLALAEVGHINEIDVTQLGIGVSRWLFEYQLLRTFNQIRIKTSDNVKLVVEVCSNNDDSEKSVQERQGLLNKILDEFRGSSVIFDMLVQARKPIVGQYLLLDLMFLHEKFYDVLPEKYEMFKSQLRSLFPDIYDTKQISTSLRKILDDRGCKMLNLGGLYTFFEGHSDPKYTVLYQPHIALAEGCRKYENAACPHEAGYDAYMCGVVFIRLAHMQAIDRMGSTNARALQFTEHMNAVKAYVNRLSLFYAAMSHVNLCGEDPTSLRPDWLLVSSARWYQKLDRLKLVAHLSRFGSFDVRPLSSSTALVAVAAHSTAQAMADYLRSNKQYSVRSYNLSIRQPRTRLFAVTTTLLAFGALACALTWKAMAGPSPVRN